MKHTPQDALDTALRQHLAASNAPAEMSELLAMASRLQQMAPPAPDAAFVERLGALLELKGAVAPARPATSTATPRRSWPWFRLSLASAAMVMLLLFMLPPTKQLLSDTLVHPQPSVRVMDVETQMQRAEQILLQVAHPEVGSVPQSELVVAYREAVQVVREGLEPAAEEAWIANQRQSLQEARASLDAVTFQALSRILEPYQGSGSVPATASTSVTVTTGSEQQGGTPPSARTQMALVVEPQVTLVPTPPPATATTTAEPARPSSHKSSPTPTPPASTPTRELPTPRKPKQAASQPEHPTPPAHPTARTTHVPPDHPTPRKSKDQPAVEVPQATPTSPAPEHPTPVAGPPEEHPTPVAGPPEEHPTPVAGPPEEQPTPVAGPPEERPTSQAPEQPTPAEHGNVPPQPSKRKP